MKTKTKFQEQSFENENDSLSTFEGHGGNFCIMLNARCIHSVKTLKVHLEKVESLVKERNLVACED